MQLSKLKFSVLFAILLTLFSTFTLINFRKFRISANLYYNEKLIKDMNEDAKYILDSITYYNHLKNESKLINNIFSKTDEYSLAKALKVEKLSQDSVIKISFEASNKNDAILFIKEYETIANEYIKSIKNNYYEKNIDILSKQYNEFSNSKNIISDNSVSKLLNYIQYTNDNNIIKLTTYTIKSKYSAKLIIPASFLLGFILPIVYDRRKDIMMLIKDNR